MLGSNIYIFSDGRASQFLLITAILFFESLHVAAQKNHPEVEIDAIDDPAATNLASPIQISSQYDIYELNQPEAILHRSPDLIDPLHSFQEVKNLKKNSLSPQWTENFITKNNQITTQTQNAASSASTDTDGDGIMDNMDLCPDHMDTALDFDGIEDYITVPHNAALNVGVGDFTLQAWVNPSGTGNQTILCKGNGHAETNYLLNVAASSTLGFYFAGMWHYSSTTIPANQWSHVAVSYNSVTKDVTFFINAAANLVVNYPNTPVTSDTNDLYMGRLGFLGCPPCSRFEGRMDDVAIWNTQRTATEIACDMATLLNGSETGLVAFYDFNESMACVNNTISTTIVDKSANGFTGTLNNFDLLPGCTSNWSSGRNLDSDQDGFGDGCEYFCFADSDGDGIRDSIDLCPDYKDTALDFDGLNDEVSIPHDPALNVGVGDFTFQAWVNPSGTGWRTILCKGTGLTTGVGTDYLLILSPTNQVLFYYGAQDLLSIGFAPNNQWSHVALTFDFTTKEAIIYINGSVSGTGDFTSAMPVTTDINPLFLGKQGFVFGGAPFHGLIDDVAIWNIKRSAVENDCDRASRLTGSEYGLVAYYDMNESTACINNASSPTIVDHSTNGFDGTLYNFDLSAGCSSNWTSGRNLDSDQDGFGDGCYSCFDLDTDDDGILDDVDLCPNYKDAALDFDGINDYVSIPHNAALNIGAGDFTLQAWVNYTTPGNFETILCKGAGNIETNYLLSIQPDGRIGLFYAGIWNYSISSIPINIWTHVAASYDFTAKQVTFFVNGTSDGTGSYPGTAMTSDTNILYVGLQGFACACNPFEGRMDDVAIWNKTRSATDIALDMATRVDSEEAGLVAYFNMNDGAACVYNVVDSMLVDRSTNGFDGTLINFDLLSGCSSNWSSGRNLDSNLDGEGDGCDYRCGTSAAVLYVDESALSGENIGTSWTNAYLSLSDAFNQAAVCTDIDSIHVAEGTYTPNFGGLVDRRTASFILPDSVKILGQFPAGGGNLNQRIIIPSTFMSGDIGVVNNNLDNSYHVVTATNVSSETLVDGFQIRDGVANGGGIDNFGGGWLNDNSSPRINQCIFIDNIASASGGGLLNFNSSPTITTSIFRECTAVRGGGMRNEASAPVVNNCTFLNNTATEQTTVIGGGGGVSNAVGATPIFNHCHFNNNMAEIAGGILNEDASPTIYACNFIFNTASSSRSILETGGAIASYSSPIVTIDSCTVTDNSAKDGGGIYQFFSGSIIKDCLIANNSASDHGGGIYEFAPVFSNIDSCTFNSNTAARGGGVSIKQTQSNLSHCTFTSNSASGSGGGLLADTTMLNLDDCHFDSNSSGFTGGGIYLNRSQTVASQTSFSNNTAINRGGGIYNFGDPALVIPSLLSLSNCQFDENIANSEGGGLASENTSTSITDCAFNQNTSNNSSGGGAFFLTAPATLTNTTFTNNIAVNAGGLHCFNDSVSLLHCQFDSNSASELGGGTVFQSSPAQVNFVAFNHNTAERGGGFYIQNIAIALADCQFNENMASIRGGGIYLNASPMHASNTTFTANTAAFFGGGIYSQNESVSLMDCQFHQNETPEIGGGMVLVSSPLNATNTTFTNNSAGMDGGALYLNGSIYSIVDCQFRLNSAVSTNSTLAFNGAIGGFDIDSLLISKCIFSENTATGGGGAVGLVNAGMSRVKHSSFKFNRTDSGTSIGTGGAYQVGGTGETTFSNCLFERNQSLGSGDDGGGALMLYGGTVNVINSTIVNNHSATQGGGVSVFDNTGDLNLTNTILWNNTAATDPIIYNGGGGSAEMTHSLFDGDSCITNVLCGPGVIYDQDPLFVDTSSVPPLGGDFNVRYGSPSINAGVNDSIPTGDSTDLNDISRIINITVDLGAYEFDYTFPCGLYGNLVIDDMPVFMGDYKASGLISSTGLVNISSGGVVSFKSETEIELNQEFEVKLGQEFNAEIEDPCMD